MPKKPRSTFDKLPDAEQERLWALLNGHTLAEALPLVEAPLDEGGFDLQTSETALGRWYQSYPIKKLARQTQRTLANIEEHSAQLPQGSTPEHTQFLILSLKQAFAHTLATGELSPDHCATMFRALTADRKLALEEERLELDREKSAREDEKLAIEKKRLRLEVRRAAQTALADQEKLAAIAADTGLSSDEKIERTLGVLYGAEFMADLRVGGESEEAA